MKNLYRFFLLIGLALAMLLGGCRAAGTPTPAPAAATPTVLATTVAPTPIPAPTATAAPERLWLVIPPGAPQPVSQEIQAAVNALAKSSNLLVETRPDIKPADIPTEVRAVVWIDAPVEAAQAAAAASRVAFILVTSADVKPAPNLTVIRLHSEYQAFAAGLVAITMTPDWRVGALLSAGTPELQAFQDAFMTGARFFCGRCMPGWPLGMVFPQVVALPPASDAKAWENAANDLIQNKKVELIFLAPESASPETIRFIRDRKIPMIGLQTPAEDLRELWAVTIKLDAVSPLQKAFPDLITGKGGSSMTAEVVLQDIQLERFGEGRQNFVRDILVELQAGLINPFSVPGQ